MDRIVIFEAYSMEYIQQFLNDEITYPQLNILLSQPTVTFTEEEAIAYTIGLLGCKVEENIEDPNFKNAVTLNARLIAIINIIFSKCPPIEVNSGINPEFVPVICSLHPSKIINSITINITDIDLFNQYIAAHANDPGFFVYGENLSELLDWILQFVNDENPLAIAPELIVPMFEIITSFETFGKLNNTHCTYIGLLAVEMIKIRLESIECPEEAIRLIINTIGLLNDKHLFIGSIDKKLSEFLTALDIFPTIMEFAYANNCTKDIMFRLITYCVMSDIEPPPAPDKISIIKPSETGLIPISKPERIEIESDMQQFIEFVIALQQGNVDVLNPEVLSEVLQFTHANNQILWLYRYAYLMVTNLEHTSPELFQILIEADPNIFQDNPELAMLFVAHSEPSMEFPEELINYIIKDIQQLPTEFYC